MDKLDRKNKNTYFETTVLVSVVFLTVVLMLAIVANFESSQTVDKIGMDYMWSTVYGDEDDKIESFVDHAVFITQVTREQAQGRCLCFFSKNVYFDVYVDNNLVYSFRPETPNIFGKFYGTMPHQVEFQNIGPSSVIQIEADSIDGSKGSFTGIALEGGTNFTVDVFRASLLPYCISIVIAFMGFLLILGGLSIMKNSSVGKEIAAMGLFAMDAGLWTACSTDVAGLAVGNPVSMHFVNYMTLIVLPAFAVIFVFFLTGRKYKLFANVLVALTVAILIMDLVLVGSGIATYHQLLIVTHTESVITVLYSYLCIAKSKKDMKKNSSTRVTVTTAFIVVASGSFIDLMRYTFIKSDFDPAYFFRLGMMIFVFILGIHEIQALLVYRKYESEAVEMSRLAYTDALTGLQNRMAFSNHEDDVRSKESGNCIIIQFDINNLKTVNDNYGHKEGDKHIKAAADIIEQSFGQMGSCYRTGGDEFIVVMENVKDKSEFEDAKVRFQKLIDEYNDDEKPRVKLEIAYGVEEFDQSSSDVERALRLADGKMYLMKKQMKGN